MFYINPYNQSDQPRVKVSESIFRSWAGRRWIDDTEYEGPVYYFLTDVIAKISKEMPKKKTAQPVKATRSREGG